MMKEAISESNKTKITLVKKSSTDNFVFPSTLIHYIDLYTYFPLWKNILLKWILYGFHRQKNVLLSLNPLFVKNDDQGVGLINLLNIAVRTLALIKFVVCPKLAQNQEKLIGLIENNSKKDAGQSNRRAITRAHCFTPLIALRACDLLGLSPTIYARLVEN